MRTKFFLIPEELVQAIGKYLAQRPWVETQSVMGPLANLQEAPPGVQPVKTEDQLWAEYHNRYGLPLGSVEKFKNIS